MLTSILNIKGLLDLFGKTHPAVAHFPVALLFSALVAEVLSWKFKKTSFHTTAKFCLYIGTLGAVVTTLTGFPFTQATFFNARPPMLVRHQLAAYMVVVLGLTTSGLVLSFKAHILNNKFIYYLYILLLVIIAGLIIYTGHTGGILVYGEDFFVPASPAE